MSWETIMKPELTEEERFIQERDRLLQLWETSKKLLEAAKISEMEARMTFVAFAFDPNKKSGTERIDLENGYQAKAVKKINYGFIQKDDHVDKDAIEAALTEIEKEGPAGQLIANRLIKWAPSLSLTEYKLLSSSYKAIIDKVIVTSDGTPSLEIIPPKSKK